MQSVAGHYLLELLLVYLLLAHPSHSLDGFESSREVEGGGLHHELFDVVYALLNLQELVEQTTQVHGRGWADTKTYCIAVVKTVSALEVLP